MTATHVITMEFNHFCVTWRQCNLWYAIILIKVNADLSLVTYCWILFDRNFLNVKMFSANLLLLEFSFVEFPPSKFIKSPWVTGRLIVWVRFRRRLRPCHHSANTFQLSGKSRKLISSNHTRLTYWYGKFFGTHLGDFGSRSLSYRSGAQFTLSPG